MNHRAQFSASLVEFSSGDLHAMFGFFNPSTRPLVVPGLGAHAGDERLEVKR